MKGRVYRYSTQVNVCEHDSHVSGQFISQTQNNGGLRSLTVESPPCMKTEKKSGQSIWDKWEKMGPPGRDKQEKGRHRRTFVFNQDQAGCV